jgi:probable phosphomutase (TIGR03848 family)
VTTLFLVRHAVHALVEGTLCGRMGGVHLGAEGRDQAERLAERFASHAVAAVQTSPLERARETAAPIASRLGLAEEVREGLAEIDFGEWTGRAFDELRDDPRWHAWNAVRSLARAPGGESMVEAQARIVGHLERVRDAQPDGAVVLVSHADMIRAALAHCLGLSLDFMLRLEIAPASVSTVEIGPWGARVIRTNEAVA